ncbi:uncharacterized protein A4U43_C05F12580 [Asparagus officinalis]|uniref:Pirin C-terminal domain-containing protein n=1 Tax=Asparagus officinalis TaxID=4686 RepID=A0A5P1EUW6_ASPOF|nr:uncharacterized protein A4U43_C05F12580 [Asparagus officinalis]
MGIKSPVYTQTPTMYLDFTLRPSAHLSQPIPPTWNSFVYILEGEGVFGSEKSGPISPHYLLLLGHGDGLNVWNRASKPLRFLLVGGEPLGEPVAQLGPFVMNTEEEIDQTIDDFQYFINGFEKAKHWSSSSDDNPLESFKDSPKENDIDLHQFSRAVTLGVIHSAAIGRMTALTDNDGSFGAHDSKQEARRRKLEQVRKDLMGVLLLCAGFAIADGVCSSVQMYTANLHFLSAAPPLTVPPLVSFVSSTITEFTSTNATSTHVICSLPN